MIPIERMIILLFENYPKLGKGGMFTFEKGLTHFIRVLAQNANVFSSCLSQIGTSPCLSLLGIVICDTVIN